MAEQLKVTSPEEYAGIVAEHEKRDAGELVKLGSGLVVRARRGDLEGKALKGGIPISLVNAVTGHEDEEEDETRAPTPEEVADGVKYSILVRETVRKNALEPKIVYDEAGEVVWEWPDGKRAEILTSDFKELFAWMSGNKGDDGLDSFRNRKQRRALASKSGGKKLRPKSVPTPA